MSYRLVEVLEYGWDLMVKCRACGLSERRSKAHFLGPWKPYLAAQVQDIAARLTCPCGARSMFVYEMAGSYARFGRLPDYLEARAVLIRETLVEAGLDPLLYGYPPLRAERSRLASS